MNRTFFKKEWLTLLLRLALLAAVFTAVLCNYDRLTHLDVRAMVEAVPGTLAAYAVVLGVFFVKGLTFVIPAMLIYVSVGMAFPAPVAIALSLCGIALEVSGTYALGRLLGGAYVERLLKKTKAGEKMLNMKGKTKGSALFTARLLPVFSIDFFSLFLGSIRYSFLPYLLLSVLGVAPRVILFTLMGEKAYNLIPMAWILRIVLVLIPAAAVAFIVRTVVKRRKTGEPADESPAEDPQK